MRRPVSDFCCGFEEVWCPCGVVEKRFGLRQGKWSGSDSLEDDAHVATATAFEACRSGHCGDWEVEGPAQTVFDIGRAPVSLGDGKPDLGKDLTRAEVDRMNTIVGIQVGNWNN